jgi:hypothetical protein
MITLLMTGFTVAFVLAYRPPDPTTARVLYDLAFALLATSGTPAAVALTAYASMAFTNSHLPRRTGHLAAVAAAAYVLLLATLAILGAFSPWKARRSPSPQHCCSLGFLGTTDRRRPDGINPSS